MKGVTAAVKVGVLFIVVTSFPGIGLFIGDTTGPYTLRFDCGDLDGDAIAGVEGRGVAVDHRDARGRQERDRVVVRQAVAERGGRRDVWQALANRG